jgi:hypothetical protein
VSHGTFLQFHVLGRGVSHYEAACGHALQDILIRSTVFLLRCALSCRDRDVRVGDVGEFVCFYPNKRRARVVVNRNAQSWDCAFMEKVKLSESFVDLIRRHIVLRLPEVAATKYHVASTNIHGCITEHLHEQ